MNTFKSSFRLLCCCLTATTIILSCEKPIIVDDGNVVLNFRPVGSTRATLSIGDYFQKLNVMIFLEDGTKYWEKVRTQYAADENFGQMSISLPPGEYTIVAVGHSSVKSATIKSPQMVQFTASNGEKLTDTFCHCSQITVDEESQQLSLPMSRVTAMIQFHFTDEEIPASLANVRFDYTGGSANFNPTTFEGTTNSSQSENRTTSTDDTYQIFTFPYMSTTSNLKVTISALASDGTIIRKRTLEQVPATRNRITTYTGPLFSEGDGTIIQTAFGFTINTEWDGEDHFTF